MKYLICGILGIAIGFFIFYLLFRIANQNRRVKKTLSLQSQTLQSGIGSGFVYLLCGSVYRHQSNTYRLFAIRGACHIHSNPDNYSNCLVLLESKGRKHYQNQAGIPGGNKGYFR